MMTNSISEKTLQSRLKISAEKAIAINAIMRNKPNLALDIADEAMGGSGIEYIPAGHNSRSPSIRYVNMGDPYVTTLMVIGGTAWGKWKIGAWGDIVERGNYD